MADFLNGGDYLLRRSLFQAACVGMQEGDLAFL